MKNRRRPASCQTPERSKWEIYMIQELTANSLYRRCDDDHLKFETTDELKDFTGIVGQQRAVDAVQFGIGVRREGYNLFVLGPPGAEGHRYSVPPAKAAEQTASRWDLRQQL
jgi:hypothetical protein